MDLITAPQSRAMSSHHHKVIEIHSASPMVPGIAQLLSHRDQLPDKASCRKEGFISGHSFRGHSPPRQGRCRDRWLRRGRSMQL